MLIEKEVLTSIESNRKIFIIDIKFRAYFIQSRSKRRGGAAPCFRNEYVSEDVRMSEMERGKVSVIKMRLHLNTRVESIKLFNLRQALSCVSEA